MNRETLSAAVPTAPSQPCGLVETASSSQTDTIEEIAQKIQYIQPVLSASCPDNTKQSGVLPVEQLEPYTYDPLPTSQSFRVLKLFPGQGEDEIVYDIHAVSWTSPPEYEAVSYAWGDINDRTTTRCGSKKLSITKSLARGLRRMRHPNYQRIVWADAVCIDQENLNERGHQVRHMIDIYRHAQNVIVWLGGDKNPAMAEQACNVIPRMASRLCWLVGLTLQDVASSLTPLPLLERLRDISSSEVRLNEQEWACLCWFFGLSWFHRLWVIQEIQMDPSAEVLCGKSKVKWDLVGIVDYYLVWNWPKLCVINHDFGIVRFGTASEIRYTGRFGESSDFTFLDKMAFASRYEASNPLDYFYGLFGLPAFADAVDSIEVDYEKSELQLFGEVANLAIQTSKSLDVLNYSNFNNSFWRRNPKQMSCFWIPEFSKGVYTNRLVRELPWCANDNTVAHVTIDLAQYSLKAAGVMVDEITFTRNPDPPFSKIYRSLDKQMLTDYLKELANSLICDLELAASVGVDPFEAESVALTFGLNQHILPANPLELRTGFLAFLKRYAPDVDLKEPEWATSCSNADYQVFERAYCLGRNRQSDYFTTKHGYFGSSRSKVEVGDIVCILFGGRFPFILRPQNDHYLLIDHTYIHGMMNGEYIRGWCDGRFPQVKEQIFDIR